jgi:hypothetical protein
VPLILELNTDYFLDERKLIKYRRLVRLSTTLQMSFLEVFGQEKKSRENDIIKMMI